MSPTVLKSAPYRFFFFASDRNEPSHVHVARERKTAKFWLSSIRLAYNYGFASTELNRIEHLVRQHEAELRFDYRKSRANRFASRMGGNAVAVVLEPDVAQVFDSSESVNRLLRSLSSALPARRRSRAMRRKVG